MWIRVSACRELHLGVKEDCLDYSAAIVDSAQGVQA